MPRYETSVLVRMMKEQRKRLEFLARRRKCPLSELVRQAVEKLLEENS